MYGTIGGGGVGGLLAELSQSQLDRGSSACEISSKLEVDLSCSFFLSLLFFFIES